MSEPADGTRDPTPADTQQPMFAAGDTVPGLSSWTLDRKLGAGGFGEVWLVKHEWKDERRAVRGTTRRTTAEPRSAAESQPTTRSGPSASVSASPPRGNLRWAVPQRAVMPYTVRTKQRGSPVFELMKCVVEGIVAKGAGGLLAEVPGGKFAQHVGEYALKRWREKHAQKKLEDAVKESIGKKADEAIAEARKAVEEAAPQLTGRNKERAVQYVAAIPEAARRTLKSKADPTGTSLPFGYTINEPDDVAKILPPQLPRFIPGEWVPGRQDNWRLERRIGGGGFGEVWLARSEWGDERRAVKFCTDPSARTKLVTHEKSVVAGVMKHARHPNIVPLRECNLSDAIPWLMYEYVEGGTLADAIPSWQALAPVERLTRAVAVLHAIASAVAHCHAADPAIVHRDLKPANVLMAGDVPRVIDFGIGGAVVDYLITEERTRGYETVAGRLPSMLSGSYSLLYSSPQQRAGEKPDPRDDVHALGVIAYQMLIGRVDAEVKGNWSKKLQTDGVPEALIDLIGASASDEADDRPNDAREWEAAIEPLLRVSALAAAPAPRPRVPRPAKPAPSDSTKPAVRAPGEIVVEFPLPNGLKMAFCWIPPGECQLGSPKAERDAVLKAIGQTEEPDWLVDERESQRGVYRSKGFWMGKYTVTQAEWHALTGELPSYFQASGGGAAQVKGLNTTNFPVEQVSWDEICGQGGFLEKLNAVGGMEKVFGKTGAFALPHEDEWEYACRGGLGNSQPFYFGKELNGTEANIDGNYPFGTTVTGQYLKRTCAVNDGKYRQHPWGLIHMHGNVFEWCNNLYGQTSTRVLRGGSWINIGHNCRAAYRFRYAPVSQYDVIGFRVFLSLDL